MEKFTQAGELKWEEKIVKGKGDANIWTELNANPFLFDTNLVERNWYEISKLSDVGDLILNMKSGWGVNGVGVEWLLVMGWKFYGNWRLLISFYI